MSASTLKKHRSVHPYPAAAQLFEQVTALFSSTPVQESPRITPKQLQASIQALKNAPVVEIAAVSAILKQMSHEINRMLPPDIVEDVRDTDDRMDAGFERLLSDKLAQRPGSLVTEQSKAEGASFMARFQADSALALSDRIEKKEMISSAELQDRLKIRRQSISDAVASRRMFAIVGPGGNNYYPAFYADPSLDRRSIEQVSKILGDLPGAVKYQFFTAESFALAATPLEALRKGRLPEVLIAAERFMNT